MEFVVIVESVARSVTRVVNRHMRHCWGGDLKIPLVELVFIFLGRCEIDQKVGRGTFGKGVSVDTRPFCASHFSMGFGIIKLDAVVAHLSSLACLVETAAITTITCPNISHCCFDFVACWHHEKPCNRPFRKVVKPTNRGNRMIVAGFPPPVLIVRANLNHSQWCLNVGAEHPAGIGCSQHQVYIV